MKNLLILLLIISSSVMAQAGRELKNLNNDKYMDRYSYQTQQQIIVCESKRGGRIYCPANTQYGVNFHRQLSYSSCNYNWGYDQNGIWVDNGCRAEFSVNFGWDQPGADENILVCESHGYQKTYCPAFLGGREVDLLRQLSYTTCYNNWGYDRNGVWVTNGCRAEFVVKQNYFGNPQNDIVYCSSVDMKFQSCDVDTRGGVEFMRQLSRASCNGNWGYDRQGIWVRNGCRAKFRILQNYNNHGGNYYNDTVTCSSRNLRRNDCPADTSGGVRLKKQLSNASCDGNWGFDHNSIWVNNGCRATFQLYINGRGRQGNHGSGNHHQNNTNNVIVCASHDMRRKICNIPQGSRVEFKKQLSRSSCDRNWGFDQNSVWVDHGCRAEFRVY